MNFSIFKMIQICLEMITIHLQVLAKKDRAKMHPSIHANREEDYKHECNKGTNTDSLGVLTK